MIKLRPVLFVFLALLLPAIPCAAQNAGQTPTYVAPATLPAELLPAPPPEDGPAFHDQLASVLATQSRNIGDAELAIIRDEQHMRLALMLNPLGPRFNASELPKTFILLNHILADATLVTEEDKRFWHVRRPYLADKRIKLLVDPINDSPAYPSGHASESRVLAEVLSLLVPEKRDELRTRADEIALHRIDAGVHYPMDIDSGRLLAMLVMGALMRSDAFRGDLAVAKEEIARVRP